MSRHKIVIAVLVCMLILVQLVLPMDLQDQAAIAQAPDQSRTEAHHVWAVLRGNLYPHKALLPAVAIRRVPPELPIHIDGEGQDWVPYTPSATDPQGDTRGGPHTDLKAVYEMADSHYLYLMVEVYDPPLLSEATIELNLDVTGQDTQHWWLHTNISSDGTFMSWTDRDQDGELEFFPITGAEVAWRNVMELRLPLAHLGGAEQAKATFVNFWRDLDGQWTWVDLLVPERP